MAQVFKTVEPVSNELIEGFIREADEKKGWTIIEDSSQKATRSFNILFDSITNFLAKVKSTEYSVGLSVEDEKETFLFGAKVEYFPNETSDELPGNWGYSFTFDPKDLADVDKKYSTNSNEFKDLCLLISKTQYGFVLTKDEESDSSDTPSEREIITLINSIAAKVIRNWVEENSVSSTPVSTEIKGKVIIEAMLDNDTKVCSITPSGELKNIIKDDAAIEYKMENK